MEIVDFYIVQERRATGIKAPKSSVGKHKLDLSYTKKQLRRQFSRVEVTRLLVL